MHGDSGGIFCFLLLPLHTLVMFSFDSDMVTGEIVL